MKIKSGDKDLLASGSIIAFQNQTLEFTFPDAGNENFIFKFHFVEDPNFNKATTETAITDRTTLEFTFKNFSFIRNFGVSVPLEVGTLNNRKFYFIYRMDAVDSKDMKLFHYTFYLGEVVNAS